MSLTQDACIVSASTCHVQAPVTSTTCVSRQVHARLRDHCRHCMVSTVAFFSLRSSMHASSERTTNLMTVDNLRTQRRSYSLLFLLLMHKRVIDINNSREFRYQVSRRRSQPQSPPVFLANSAVSDVRVVRRRLHRSRLAGTAAVLRRPTDTTKSIDNCRRLL